MDRQHMTDLLLENESLTDNLSDTAARALRDWAIARLHLLPAPQEEHFTALVRFLRQINRLAGALPDVYAEDLANLLSMHQSAFGAARAAGEAECARFAAQLSSLTDNQMINALLEWVVPSAHTPESHSDR